MNPETYPYCVYIVRVWKENNLHANPEGWRFTVTAVPSQQRQGFAGPEALCNALYADLLQLIYNASSTEQRPFSTEAHRENK